MNNTANIIQTAIADKSNDELFNMLQVAESQQADRANRAIVALVADTLLTRLGIEDEVEEIMFAGGFTGGYFEAIKAVAA